MQSNYESGKSKLTPRGKTIKVAVAGAATVGAVLAGMNIAHGSPKVPEKSASHSISYLNGDEMKNGIIVGRNDTPEGIVQVVNGNRLSGQALLDASRFVSRQGEISEVGSDGKTHHYIHEGQLVEAPVMSDQQIADVNSGKLN